MKNISRRIKIKTFILGALFVIWAIVILDIKVIAATQDRSDSFIFKPSPSPRVSVVYSPSLLFSPKSTPKATSSPIIQSPSPEVKFSPSIMPTDKPSILPSFELSPSPSPTLSPALPSSLPVLPDEE